jgi:PhoH-like ATPase|tara:strand:+ start:6265 stop:7590 length:1326 start_codon:yes stop_codon:yes gene_type:complete
MTKKFYVLDTSVYLTDSRAIYSYGNNDIIIPLIVLEELDNCKKRPNGIGLNSRSIIRILDDLRAKGNFQKGIRIKKGAGMIYTQAPDLSLLPIGYSNSVPDHHIIASALTLSSNNPSKKVIVVSNDINLRIKCDAVGIPSEGYKTENVINQSSELYGGFTKLLVDDQIIDRFYAGENIFLENATDDKAELYPNQFVMLVSSSNEKKTAITRFVDENIEFKKIPQYKESDGWGIAPKNKEQNCALELLLDKNIPVVSLIGKAGSGKTLCAIAAGLQQIMGQESNYNRLIVSRPVQPMGKDIGYIPGTIEEKMAPWLAPIQDNLRFLFGDDNLMLESYMEKRIIEVEALTYIRGRSIQNAYIIIDECQNLTRHEIKTILTRVGEGTKIVLTGDIEQIDNVNIDETTNGLTYVIEKLKDSDITGHITFIKGERSKVATLCAKTL